MIRNLYLRLLLIVIVAVLAIFVTVNREIQITNPFNNDVLYQKNISPRLGLDLQGGLQVLLEADIPEGQNPSAAEMETARAIVENRTNAMAPPKSNVRKRSMSTAS